MRSIWWWLLVPTSFSRAWHEHQTSDDQSHITRMVRVVTIRVLLNDRLQCSTWFRWNILVSVLVTISAQTSETNTCSQTQWTRWMNRGEVSLLVHVHWSSTEIDNWRPKFVGFAANILQLLARNGNYLDTLCLHSNSSLLLTIGRASPYAFQCISEIWTLFNIEVKVRVRRLRASTRRCTGAVDFNGK